jgi:flagellar hook-associated protein 1 FlgK
MAELINTVHSNEGEHPNFFVSGSGGKIRAATIRVNPDLKDHPQDIIAGKTADGPEGDGSRALAIARLRDVSLNAAGYSKDTFSFSSQSGDTSDARYRSMIAELGVSSAYSRNMAENETSLLNQLHQRRESVMGVSVDEEISALIKFQNGYQANARVMSTLVSMLDTLISMAR